MNREIELTNEDDALELQIPDSEVADESAEIAKQARRLALIEKGSPRHKKTGYRPPSGSWKNSYPLH